MLQSMGSEKVWQDLVTEQCLQQCHGEEQISRCPGIVWKQSLGIFIFWLKFIPEVCMECVWLFHSASISVPGFRKN